MPLPGGVPTDATAIAVNVTSVDEPQPGYLAARPAGSPPGTTSFLNMNGSGKAVAATAILPVSSAGLTLYSRGGGHVIVDFLGWFTGPGAADSTVGLFVPLGPQRLLDTRTSGPRAWPGGTVELANPFPDNAAGQRRPSSPTSRPRRTDRAGYVTAFPAGTPRPDDVDAQPVDVGAHARQPGDHAGQRPRSGVLLASSGSDVVVDVTGLFTGPPVAATEAPAPNAPLHSRVLLVGDSTLAAVENLYPDSQRALIGFEGIVDAKSCRRLLRTSCLSAVTHVVPNTAVEAILETPGTIDILVVKTGYNDWNSNFPLEFDAVVNAGRAKGAHTILWLSYTENVRSPGGRRANQENNADLFHLVTLPQYSDVVLADWRAYTAGITDWTWDGSHLTEIGSWLQTDYVAQMGGGDRASPVPAPVGPGRRELRPVPQSGRDRPGAQRACPLLTPDHGVGDQPPMSRRRPVTQSSASRHRSSAWARASCARWSARGHEPKNFTEPCLACRPASRRRPGRRRCARRRR